MADTSVLGIFTDNSQVRDLIGRYLTSSKISEIPIRNLTSTACMEIFVLVKLEKMNDDCNFLLTRVTKGLYLLTCSQRYGSVFWYKLRYIAGFGLVEMAISTNPKSSIYCSSIIHFAR